MKKPSALVQLLEELQSEHNHSDVETVQSSKAIIYLTDDAAEAEDGIELNGKECSRLFASPATVDRLLDVLETEEASLALFDVNIPGHILELLERSFVAVDEG